jgi:uncharacterized protein (DUF2062 family)
MVNETGGVSPESGQNDGRLRRGWRASMRRRLPSAESIRSNRWVGWLGPVLSNPRIWHLNRSSVALGVAIGLFFGLLIPLGQIPIAALAAVWLRANLVVTISSTLVTNPLTYPPIYLVAYQIGALLTGERPEAAAEAVLVQSAHETELIATTWAGRFVTIGKPLAIGLVVLACSAAPIAYFSVLGMWRLVATSAWRRRRQVRT